MTDHNEGKSRTTQVKVLLPRILLAAAILTLLGAAYWLHFGGALDVKTTPPPHMRHVVGYSSFNPTPALNTVTIAAILTAILGLTVATRLRRGLTGKVTFVALFLALSFGVYLPSRSVVAAKAGQMRMVMNGRQLYRDMMARLLTGPGAGPVVWPDGTRFQTSTAYFKALFVERQGEAPVFTSSFSAPGLPRVSGFGVDALTKENNAWSVVAAGDQAISMSGRPLLLSRNVAATNLLQLHGQIVSSLSDMPPFGRKGAAIVTSDGSVRVLDKEGVAGTWEEVLGQNVTLSDMDVLHP